MQNVGTTLQCFAVQSVLFISTSFDQFNRTLLVSVAAVIFLIFSLQCWLLV